MLDPEAYSISAYSVRGLSLMKSDKRNVRMVEISEKPVVQISVLWKIY